MHNVEEYRFFSDQRRIQNLCIQEIILECKSTILGFPRKLPLTCVGTTHFNIESFKDVKFRARTKRSADERENLDIPANGSQISIWDIRIMVYYFIDDLSWNGEGHWHSKDIRPT